MQNKFICESHLSASFQNKKAGILLAELWNSIRPTSNQIETIHLLPSLYHSTDTPSTKQNYILLCGYK
jgi:hypothetical protein